MWMGWRVRAGLIVWWATYRTESEALEAAGLSDKRYEESRAEEDT
jgi:hypothetical protein